MLSIDVRILLDAPVEVPLGDSFELRAFVQDLREVPAGVSEAYVDVDYDNPALLLHPLSIDHDPVYNLDPQGTVTAGLIDDAGGADTDGDAPPAANAGEEFRLFSVQFQTLGVGTVTFAPRPSGNIDYPIAVFPELTTLSAEQVEFIGASVDIVPLTLSIDDVTVDPEGDTGTTNAVFTVTLSAASQQTVTVDYATADGTATAGEDYQTASGQLTFTPGTTQQTISVPVIGDTLDEIDEDFFVNLSNPVAATIDDGQGEGTIIDDDPQPSLSIDDVTVDPEGDSGTTDAVFAVTLSAPSGQLVTVDYTTADGTATAGEDYQTASGILTFAAGETQQTISVPVIGDTLDEIDENFLVNLSNPVNATIDDAQGEGIILDDDPPGISIDDLTIDPEGHSGTSNAVFTVTLSTASAETVTVDYATADGTATAGEDYQTVSGQLTFTPGTTQQTISVPVIGDALDEIDENFFVNLSNPVAATIDDAQGEGTIIDDDTAGVLITESDDSTDVTEGDPGGDSYTVRLTSQPTGPVTITVTPDSQVEVSPTTALTFTSGDWDIPKTVTVTAADDDGVEGPHSGTITHGAASTDQSYHGIAIPDVTANITDNDTASIAFVSNSSTAAEAITPHTVDLVLSIPDGGVLERNVTVDVIVDLDASTATLGVDFRLSSAKVTFLAGSVDGTIKTASLEIINDGDVEGDETVRLQPGNLIDGTNGQVNVDPNEHVVTIDDNDTAAVSFVSDSSLAIEASGSHTVNVQLLIPSGGVLERPVTVDVVDLLIGTADTPDDYTLVTTLVSFAAGSRNGNTKPVQLAIVPDSLAEQDETVGLELQNLVDGTGGQVTLGPLIDHVVTITDDSLTASLSGFVYADTNDNGQFDDDELGLPCVTVILTGTDSAGNPIARTALTDDSGAYRFENLPAITGELIEVQPGAFSDGQDKRETDGTFEESSGNDRFSEIVLEAGEQRGGYNFGERNLGEGFVSKRLSLASTPSAAEVYRGFLDCDQKQPIPPGPVELSQDGSQVSVTGSEGDDAFEFRAGSEFHTVIANGTEHTFSAAEVTSFVFDGGAGKDTTRLTGTGGNDDAELRPMSGTLTGSAYAVDVVHSENILVDSGGEAAGQADMFDSDGNDWLRAQGKFATLWGDDFVNWAFDFDPVVAHSEFGGDDTTDIEDLIDFALTQEGPWHPRA